MTTPRPLALLSNDDGYESKALHALHRALVDAGADVVVVAPSNEQSATSHSLSLHRPLRARSHGDGIFSLDGTPADCVYIALHAGDRFLPRRPDVVVSGINRGLNLGQDAFYSGTVAAAREGALRGIPALASSAHVHADLPKIAEVSAFFALSLVGTRSSAGKAPLLSLNAPEVWSGEVRVCRLGSRLYDELVDVRVDPRGREYLWLGGPGVRHEPDPGSDTEAYDAGAVTLTPLVIDLSSPAETGFAERLAASLRAR
jgi:5'-nucleotidase